ncbi:MAG: tRNA lysidine(34) synthetase TilS [Akkermansia sp.]|nr:tRNA lysidine(34) synthetase TilS [Akkermansia sp.]
MTKSDSQSEPTLPLEPDCLPYLQQPVVLGLSGGRDSVALLRLLVQQGCSVHALHVHHGIRAAEADADAAFCARLCEKLDVPFELQRVDVPTLAAEQGISLETAGRHARRWLLAAAARRYKGHTVALAHHADDQAETVLFHLARGSAGMRGMQPVHEAGGITWIRPLLSCRRTQITEWLQQLKQPWRDDATNNVPDVARNALRLEVLPMLNKALGRDVTPILNRSARLQGETQEALEAALAALPMLDPQERLYLPFVWQQPVVLQKAILRRYLQLNRVADISEELVLSILSILPADASTARVNLPGDRQACRKERRLIITPA